MVFPIFLALVKERVGVRRSYRSDHRAGRKARPTYSLTKGKRQNLVGRPKPMASPARLTSLQDRLVEKLSRDLGGQIVAAIANPQIIEILLNADGTVWLESLGGDMAPHGVLDAPSAAAVIRTAATLAEQPGGVGSPIVQCTLPFRGERFEGILPPISEAPIFSIRKRALQVFTLQDMRQQGVIDPAQHQVLVDAVIARRNIVVSGGVSSGKTTFCNALVAEISVSTPEHRIVIIEDTPELQCAAPNFVALCSSEAADMGMLLRATLRLRPDRILVGEVRGGEALTLLKAWNTGHPGGMCTVHANSPKGALLRLEQLAAEAAPGNHTALVTEAVDLVLQLQRSRERGRYVESMKYVREGE